jgi:hypothetical protein
MLIAGLQAGKILIRMQHLAFQAQVPNGERPARKTTKLGRFSQQSWYSDHLQPDGTPRPSGAGPIQYRK